MKKITLNLAAAVFLSGLTAYAGTFTNSLSDPNSTEGITFGGAGTLSDGTFFTAGIANGYLVLTTNQNNLQGSAIINDLDPGAAVGGFTITFDMLLDSGGATPADGMSV